MVAFDADTVLTGSADGLIRIIGILPNAMLGLVGEHAQVRLSRSGGLDLASRHHLQPSSMHWQPARCQAVPVLESNAQMRYSWRWFDGISIKLHTLHTHTRMALLQAMPYLCAGPGGAPGTVGEVRPAGLHCAQQDDDADG